MHKFASNMTEFDFKRSSGVIITDFEDLYIGYTSAADYYLAFNKMSK